MLDAVSVRVEPDVHEDEIPTTPSECMTNAGDMWLLGNHRLLCGDSTSQECVERLLVDTKIDCLITDPPYNVDYTGKTKDALKVSNDSMDDASFREFLCACFRLAFSNMKAGASFYIFHSDSEGYNFRGAVKDCGEVVRQCLIWLKNCMVIGRQDYQWKHEPCLYGWKAGSAHAWHSDRKQTTVLEFDRPSEDHPTMKPVKMIAYLMANSTEPDQIVYDPFLGSGTTLIAAHQLGRVCYGMELSPRYCDVIVKRWESLSGQKAIKH
jgi:site-specific DNA-methyltransferase (adenine-specific)